MGSLTQKIMPSDLKIGWVLTTGKRVAKKNPAKRRYVTSVSLFNDILVLGMAKSLSWAVTKYCVEVGWALTK